MRPNSRACRSTPRSGTGGEEGEGEGGTAPGEPLRAGSGVRRRGGRAGVARRRPPRAGHGDVEVDESDGKGKLDKNLSGENAAAKVSSWFVLRDLDHDPVLGS
jgi:hypothetical protein